MSYTCFQNASTGVTMKSPFLIDLCIISDKSLSSSYPPYLGYFLSPLVPHCPLTTSGPGASTSNCFPKDAPSTCLLPIVHLLLQQFHILPSVNIWDCARHMSAFLQCAFISHSLTTVTLFPRIIRIRVHQLWNVHILPRMFSALFSSHTAEQLSGLIQSDSSCPSRSCFEAPGRQCPGHEMWPRPLIFSRPWHLTCDKCHPNLIFSCENLTPCETWLQTWYFHTQKINVSAHITFPHRHWLAPLVRTYWWRYLRLFSGRMTTDQPWFS